MIVQKRGEDECFAVVCIMTLDRHRRRDVWEEFHVVPAIVRVHFLCSGYEATFDVYKIFGVEYGFISGGPLCLRLI